MKRVYDIPREALVVPPLQPSPDVAALQAAPRAALRLEPPRQPRDEAALLLTVAAEVEHALMVQYLYAAYSVRYDQKDHAQQGLARAVHFTLLQIAREEMGHLMTVQNLLHLIGSPLHFEREHSPFESELYPFRFKLEPLSSHALAKYVTAERPATKPPHIPDDEWQKLLAIEQEARCANDGRPVQHVGPIYDRLIALFQDAENGLQNSDFNLSGLGRQATWRDWGYDASLEEEIDSYKVYVETFFEGVDPADLRSLAVVALQKIAEQGEGFGAGVDSHFERFFQLHQDFHTLQESGLDFVWPVAVNPSTTAPAPQPCCRHEPLEAIRVAFQARGYIANDCSRAWGHLLNFRYRLLISCLSHFLHIAGPRYLTDGPNKGDRTARGFLLLWTFNEMRHLRKIAQKLVQLPLHDPADGLHAGPPFQLPYTVAIPDGEAHRWRAHLDVVQTSMNLVQQTLRPASASDEQDPFLEDLQAEDQRMATILQALAADQPIPPDVQPKAFHKVAHFLEEAVRGFFIEAHGNFWAGIQRNAFVNLHMFNQPFLNRDPDRDCQLTADGSFVLRRLGDQSKANRMPRYRPNIDPARLEFFRQWVNAQAPDNDPPGQPGVHHERTPNVEAVSPSAPQTLSATPGYAADIRPLFRDFDVESLTLFDGIDVNDIVSVRTHAADILQRLETGALPYDASWPPEDIAQFARWVQAGQPD